MRRVESCNRWFLSHRERSLSFTFTILVAVYDIPYSYGYLHTPCPSPCSYTSHSLLLIRLPTTMHTFLEPTLTDSTLCMALGSGVWCSLWTLFFDLYVMLNRFELRVRQPLRDYWYKAWTDHYASDEHNTRPVSQV